MSQKMSIGSIVMVLVILTQMDDVLANKIGFEFDRSSFTNLLADEEQLASQDNLQTIRDGDESKFDRMSAMKINRIQSVLDSFTSAPSTMATFMDVTDDISTITTDNSNASDISSGSTDIDATVSLNTTTIIPFTTTSNESITNSTSIMQSEKNLPLIIGLTLGLGMPVGLLVIGGLAYYLKIYRPRQTQVATRTR